jgi:hypothetical protein
MNGDRPVRVPEFFRLADLEKSREDRIWQRWLREVGFADNVGFPLIGCRDHGGGEGIEVCGHRAVLLTEAFGNSKSPATACVIVRFRKGLEFKDIDETGDALAKGTHDLGSDDFEDANDDAYDMMVFVCGLVKWRLF